MLVFVQIFTTPFADAFETRCSSQPNYLLESPDIWESKNSKELIYKLYWILRDPESCITSIGKSKATLERPPLSELIPSNFTFERLKDSVIVSSQIIINQKSLESLANKDFDRKGLDIIGGVKVEVEVIRDEPKGKNTYVLQGDYSLKNLWSDWFAKQKGTYSEACSDLLAKGGSSSTSTYLASPYSLKTVTATSLIYQLVIPDADCIDWVFTGPLSEPSYSSIIKNNNECGFADECAIKYGGAYLHANYPFWLGTSSEYFQGITSDDSFVKVFTAKCFQQNVSETSCIEDKRTNLKTEQKFLRVGNSIIIDITISKSSLEQISREQSNLYFIHGIYARTYQGGFVASSGWTTSCKTVGKITTCTSYKGSGGTYSATTGIRWESKVSEIKNFYKPVLDAETKAKADKAAIELKAKQEAEAAKLAAELKVKQDSDLEKCVTLNVRLFDLRTLISNYQEKYPGNLEFVRLERVLPSTLQCNLYKQTSFSLLVAQLDSSLATLDIDVMTTVSAAAGKSATEVKKVTITCTKGKLTKKVTAVKPVCPKGYKKK